MGTGGVTRYDKYLTDLALAYPTGNLIGEIVCPRKSVVDYSDRVYHDADDAIMLKNDEAEGVPSNEVDFATGDAYSYRTTRKALSAVVLDKEADNASKIAKLSIRETNKLTHRLKLKHEYRVSAVMNNAAIVTQNKNVTATANAQWDETTPVLETDIILAVSTIFDNCGATANTIIIPFKAALYAANMTFIKNTLQYQYGMQVIQASFQNQVMKLVGLPPVIKGLNVVISSGRMDDSNKGEAADVQAVWGKNCLIGYVPPNTSIEDIFGVLTMEYESFKVWKERQTDPRGTKIVAEWDYDILQANMATWYLLRNVIS